MSISLRTAVLVILALCVDGCGDSPTPETGAALPLDEGGFVALTSLADLRGSPAIPVDNPALWTPLPVVPREGWGPQGRGWNPVGSYSALRFWRRTGGGSALVLNFSHRPESPHASYRIGVSVNGTDLGEFETSPGRVQQRFLLPVGLLTQVNDLDLAFDPPVELVEGPPQLSLLRLGFEAPSNRGDASIGSEGFAINETGALEIERSGTFLLPVDVPPSAMELALRARNLTREWVANRFFIDRSNGQRVDLGAARLTGEKWQEQVVSVEAWRGESAVLGWEIDLSGPGGRVELGQLEFRPSSQTQEPEETRTQESRKPASLPDVLLIVLDAARGDRFPGWDYPRQTMPVIDELGRRALQFRHAFAECPTTSCSVPAIITGIPFLWGGQVGGGSELADGVKTLAEYLDELGYRTIGFSATPNNSASHNLDQGFEEFHELWGRDNPHHGPFNLSRLAGEAIQAQPADEPLFLQLHYLPPHQPYDPPPEFDRFTDPGYSGEIRPDMSLRPYSLGLQPLDGEDLEYLIGLYDGNLSVADAAVGQVLEALEAAGRSENTLIVITSDHGEAFMEHGRQGHNTTLFDEMLHVPLLLRLPQDEVPMSVQQDRLASVLDIVPTVLGYLGAMPSPQVGGLDLLRSQADPLRPRVLYFRTSHRRHAWLAARTPTWKAISWPRHQVQMLFHLVDDPGEERNLVGEKPLVYAGLGLRIRRHLVESSAGQLEGEQVEISEEAQKALRALGYLD